jgi:hypothetical protein
MQLWKKILFIHDKYQINFLTPVMFNFYIFDLKSDEIYNFLQKKWCQIILFSDFHSKKQTNLGHCNHFFNDHKTFINNNFQNLIRRKQSNDEFLNTAAIAPNVPFQEKQNKFLPTDASFLILGRYLEVVSLNDRAVESGQPTERKTKTLGTSGLISRQT